MTDNNASAIPEVDRESLIEKRLPLDGARVVDIGCGEGWLSQLVAPKTRSIVGIDPSETAIERARAKQNSANETYLLASADNLPLEDSWADIVVYFNSLHHVPAEIQPKAARESARVLATGGLLCIVEPLPKGSAYQLFQPVEDESEVYDATYRLIRELTAEGDFKQDLEEFFIDTYIYESFEDFLDHVVAVDKTRETAVIDLRDSLLKRFDRLGQAVEGGRSFDQVHRLNLLRRL